MLPSENSGSSGMNVSFLVDFFSGRTGYYIGDVPDDIEIRSMSKVLILDLMTYTERRVENKTTAGGEIDIEEFFNKLKDSKIKEDTFYELFLDHGKNFLPKFKKWESINIK